MRGEKVVFGVFESTAFFYHVTGKCCSNGNLGGFNTVAFDDLRVYDVIEN